MTFLALSRSRKNRAGNRAARLQPGRSQMRSQMLYTAIGVILLIIVIVVLLRVL